MPATARVLLLSLFLPDAGFGQQALLRLANGSGAPGAAVSLDLTLSSAQAAAAVQWTLNYWPVDISSIQVTAGPVAAAAGKSLNCAGTPGVYNCIVAGISTNTIADGVIAQVTVQLSPATPDAVSTLRVSNALAAASNATAIPVEGVAGVVTILQPAHASGIDCSPPNVVTPGSASCTVTLSAPAPVGGLNVTLSSSNSSVTLPGSVTVPAGASSAVFKLSASQVASTTLAGIGAGALSGTVVLAPPGVAASVAAIFNAADYSTIPVAPGEIVAILGSGIGPAEGVGFQIVSGKVPVTLAGTQVLFDGKPAPVLYASSDQVNAIVPNQLSGTTTQLQIQYGGTLSAAFSIPVTPASPGIFTADASGAGQGAILNQDGTANSPANPTAPGSLVMIYATGGGRTNPPSVDGNITGTSALPRPVNTVSVRIGGTVAEVPFAGAAPNLIAGALQVNARIPQGIATGPAVPVTLIIGGVISRPGATVAIQ